MLTINVLLLDDQVQSALGAVSAGLRRFSPSCGQPVRLLANPGFWCVIPQDGEMPEIRVEVYTNQANNQTAQSAWSDAQQLIKNHKFNLILVDEAWGPTTDRSGHEVLLSILTENKGTFGEPNLRLAIFSQHLKGENEPGSIDHDVKVAFNKVTDVWKGNIRRLIKSDAKALGDLIEETIRDAPRDQVMILVQPDGNSYRIELNGNPWNPTSSRKPWVLAYLKLHANGHAVGKVPDLLPKIRAAFSEDSNLGGNEISWAITNSTLPDQLRSAGHDLKAALQDPNYGMSEAARIELKKASPFSSISKATLFTSFLSVQFEAANQVKVTQ